MFNNGTRNELIQSVKHLGNIRQLTSSNTLRNGYFPELIILTNEPSTSKSSDPTLFVKGLDSEKEPPPKIPMNVIQVSIGNFVYTLLKFKNFSVTKIYVKQFVEGRSGQNCE